MESGSHTSSLLDALRAQWRQASAGDATALATRVRSLQQVLWKFNAVGHIGRRDGPTCWLEAVSPTATSPELPDLPSEAALDEFRSLFPPVLCYTRIVPVDEVVTLTLFYREDHQLKRLMLDDQQSAELDRLWEELLYVSREPIQLTVALEQISEFATQDRPDLVESFAPLKEPIQERAEAFRQKLQASEPIHVQSILQLADRAWRRPLTAEERSALQALYGRLRAREIPHEEAIQLALVRILTSPLFLYKLEQSPPGRRSAPVSDWELATRLSYFLWSSIPDEPLRAAAAAGHLTDAPRAEETSEPIADRTSMAHADSELRRQTRRMLQDWRTRRLAIQFACQWLHVRDFDQNDDKNEVLYPELRSCGTTCTKKRSSSLKICFAMTDPC